MVERQKVKNLKVFKSTAGALFSQGGVNTSSILSARLSWGCISVGRTGALCPVLVSESVGRTEKQDGQSTGDLKTF